MKGLFITFEGPDASGKTTQIHLLEKYLHDRGIDPVTTREPGGTEISEKIRQIILDKDNYRMLPVTEALLYAASRAQHVGEKLLSELKSGKIVISDRFLDSSIAYQGYGRGMGDLIKQMNFPATTGLLPDVTFILKIEPELMRRRRRSDEEDRMDAQQLSFHKDVLNGYMDLAKAEPERIYVIDAERVVDEIFKDIIAVIEPLLRQKEFI